MLKLDELKKDPKFPRSLFIASIGNPEIKKVFPEIGLANFSEKSALENTDEISPAVRNLILFIHSETNRRLNSLTRYAEIKSSSFGERRKITYKTLMAILRSFKMMLTRKEGMFITRTGNGGKITLNLPDPILDDEKKVLFKKGEGLIRVYGKLNELLRSGHFVAMSPLDQAQPFKNFNNLNMGGDSSKIVFSSSDKDGAWDIATMSMRGIQSCQSWHSTNSHNLIGSILDPFTGIMYLTNGTDVEGRGVKMNRRCLVRLAVNQDNSMPTLILERMYPSHSKVVASAFIKLLLQKTGNKFAIIDLSNSVRNGGRYYLPYVPVTRALFKLNRLTYRDSACLVNDLSIKTAEDFCDRMWDDILHGIWKGSDLLRKKDLKDKVAKAYWSNGLRCLSTINDLLKLELAKEAKIEFDALSGKETLPEAKRLYMVEKILSPDRFSSLLKRVEKNYLERYPSIPATFNAALFSKIEAELQSRTIKVITKLTKKAAKEFIANKGIEPLPTKGLMTMEEFKLLVNKVS